MTLHEEWTDQLSEYLDDDLTTAERAAVEAHLLDCRECAASLNDLKRLVARAQNLPSLEPRTDLWPGIAESGMHFGRRFSTRSVLGAPPRRVTLTLTQFAAAAVVVAAVSGGLVWQFAPTPGETAPGQVAQAFKPVGSGSGDSAVVVPVGLADAQYDAAVADLELALKTGRGQLDASTIAIVEHNIEIIDRAIGQAREALDADPANSYLSSHLVEARRRKLDLLRRANALTAAN